MTLIRSRIIVLPTAHDAISWTPPQERNDGPLRVMQDSAFQLGCARVRLVSRRRESFGARWCAPRWRRVAGRVAVWFVQGGVRVAVARGVGWLVVTRRECAPWAPRTLFFERDCVHCDATLQAKAVAEQAATGGAPSSNGLPYNRVHKSTCVRNGYPDN